MFCHVNGIRLYYEICGSGRPLLLIHGNGEDHTIFDAALEPLSRHYCVYTVDSRCHGQSTNTDEISYDLMADDLIAFIKTQGLEQPLFYGFSDGGILGLLVAIREPALLGRLIVSGANLNPLGLQQEERDVIHSSALQGDRLCRLMDTQPDISPAALEGVTVPTVVLAGEYDLILPEHTRLIAASIPGAQLHILPGEDHGSYIVHSPKLAPILSRYL